MLRSQKSTDMKILFVCSIYPSPVWGQLHSLERVEIGRRDLGLPFVHSCPAAPGLMVHAVDELEVGLWPL